MQALHAKDPQASGGGHFECLGTPHRHETNRVGHTYDSSVATNIGRKIKRKTTQKAAKSTRTSIRRAQERRARSNLQQVFEIHRHGKFGMSSDRKGCPRCGTSSVFWCLCFKVGLRLLSTHDIDNELLRACERYPYHVWLQDRRLTAGSEVTFH